MVIGKLAGSNKKYQKLTFNIKFTKIVILIVSTDNL